MGKLLRDCVFNFTCRIVNIIHTFTVSFLLLNNCEAKTVEKVFSDDDLMSVVHNCYMSVIACQSLYFTIVASYISNLIGSFEKVFKSLFCFVVTHFADGVVRSILFSSVLVMRLTTLPESIIAFACVFETVS